MSLFNALHTGASGMLAHTRATQTISTNVANTNTIGYKRSEIAFSNLVGETNGKTSSGTVTGGVGFTQISRVNDQGAISQTSSNTDLAIAGNGFFVVNQTSDGSGDFLYTRAGQFNADVNGILKNTAGYSLYGYLSDADGNVGTDLVPVDLSLFPIEHFETTEISLSMNLDAKETPTDTHTLETAQQLPIGSTRTADYSRAIEIYDENGDTQSISVQYRHIVGPMAHLTSHTALELERDDVLVDNANGKTDAITNGDIFSISNGTDTLAVTFVNTTADTSLNEANTMGDVLDIINSYTGSGTDQLYLAQINDNGQLLVQSLDPAATVDISGSSANVLAQQGLDFIQDPDATPDYTYEPDFDITAVATATSAYPNQGDLPTFTDTATTNPYGWWEMTVVHTDPSTNISTDISQGLLNFDGNGQLNATTATGENHEITLDAANLPYATTEGLTIELTSLTQQSGAYQTGSFRQNGAPATVASEVNISNDGTVFLKFASDLRRPVYKLALADFANPEGLDSANGTAYSVNNDGSSGDVILSAAGEDGLGSIQSSALENSNVDLSNEFGELIVSQRAYSMNSQIVQAANEMTQTLNQLTR